MTDTSILNNKAMRIFYVTLAAALVLTVLAVWFVPGVDDFVEVTFQRYLGRAAS